jgi:hypothetical protein
VEFGFGFVPRSHGGGSGNAVMHLDTDTSAAANPAFTRLAGSGGRITLDVRKSSEFYRRTTGSQQLRLPGSRIHTNGSETTVSAVVEGFAVVGPVAGATSAELASSRSTTVEVVKEEP